jgi:hypothetical protein
MNRLEIIKFIAENQNERLLDYYDKCYEKLKDLNQRIDKITLYLIVITFLYFIASSTRISSLQLGPANISDVSLLLIVIPVLFAFLLLQIVIISSHKAELFMTVKFIFLSNYKQDVNFKELENDRNNFFTRILFPFSYSTEMLKFNTEKPSLLSSCLGVILIVPLLSLIFLPFIFEYYMLKIVWKNYYTGILGIASFWLSNWINAYIIYYIIHNAIKSYQGRKQEFS